MKLAPGRSKNYVLKQEYRFDHRGELVTLPAGTFVRPLSLEYVPKHILEDKANKYFNPDMEVFCYTRYGIISIFKNAVLEVA